MFDFPSARSASVAACALLAAGLLNPAHAKKAPRQAPAVPFSAAELIAIPKFSSLNTTAPALPQAPARFFTINGALARGDAGRAGDAPLRLATASPATDLADVLENMPAAHATNEEPFGMQAFRAPEGLLWLKWRTLQKESLEEEARLKSCQTDQYSCTGDATRFWSMVGQIKTASGRARLEKANQLVNTAIAYASDLSVHGQLDRWSAPLATLKSGKGDCEDYAVLKYKLLVEAGVPAGDLRIVLIRDTSVRIDHAVLSARVHNRWYILDNRKSGFYVEQDLPHYMPLFALDQSGVKLFAAPFASLKAADPDDSILPGLADDAAAVAAGDTLPLVF
jgi:predicted transglutaminase-like cysteine proteinase